MIWLCGIIGFAIGATTGWVFGCSSGMDVAAKVTLVVIRDCDACKAKFESIFRQMESGE
jgi:hypothetical protein